MGVLFENSIVCHVFYAIVGWLVLGFLGLVVLVFFGLPALFSSSDWGGLGLEFCSLFLRHVGLYGL